MVLTNILQYAEILLPPVKNYPAENVNIADLRNPGIYCFNILYLTHFYLLVSLITQRAALKFPTIIVNLSLLPFSSVCLTKICSKTHTYIELLCILNKLTLLSL